MRKQEFMGTQNPFDLRFATIVEWEVSLIRERAIKSRLSHLLDKNLPPVLENSSFFRQQVFE